MVKFSPVSTFKGLRPMDPVSSRQVLQLKSLTHPMYFFAYQPFLNRFNQIPAFGQNLYATCQQTFSGATGLSAFCSSSGFGTLTLFNNFNSSLYVGRYGSSNINYISVSTETMEKILIQVSIRIGLP